MEWLMIFVGGLLGSSHCIGMCGGFALALSNSKIGLAANVRRQVVYSLGRVFTYSLAGGVAGYAGWRLMMEFRLIVNVQAVLSILAGTLLLIQGLAHAGFLWRQARSSLRHPCLGPAFFGALLAATRLRNVFLGGVVNGLLPCGLVYAYLALSASSGDMLQGWLTMALFGLGTLPIMILVGTGGAVFRRSRRWDILRAAAWCVVLTGILTLLRGLTFLHEFGLCQYPHCPICR
jgi:sulfite exporter TauE/SafE